MRVPGGGDRALIVKQKGLLAVLDELVHPHRRGSPVSLLWWSSRSGARLADDLVGEGFKVSERTVLRLLGLLGFSLLANARVLEGSRHADRDGQFRCLNALAEGFVEGGEPVISVDTKKSSWSGRARGKDEMLSGPAGRGRRFLIGAV